MKGFLKSNKAIFWVIFVGVVTMTIATATWLVAMVITGAFVDSMTAHATSSYTVNFGETVRNQGAIVVVLIDVGMLVWMGISAFRKETQEAPLSF